MIYTEVQVMRWYSALYTRMSREFPGQVFGFDQRTLALNGGQGWLNAITRLARMVEESMR